MEQMS